MLDAETMRAVAEDLRANTPPPRQDLPASFWYKSFPIYELAAAFDRLAEKQEAPEVRFADATYATPPGHQRDPNTGVCKKCGATWREHHTIEKEN